MRAMESILGGLAVALPMAGQLLAVIAVYGMSHEDDSADQPGARLRGRFPRNGTSNEARTQHIWLFGE